MANFILSYDLMTGLKIQTQLSAFVKSNRNIDQWSQPFTGVFLIKSPQSLAVLADDFRNFFGETLFIIAPAAKADGWLPGQFWTWFNMADATPPEGLLGIGAYVTGREIK